MRQIVTSVDIGSNSVKVIVAEIFKTKLFVLSCVEVKSRGIKKGLIVDLELALNSVKKAIKNTEEILGIPIKRVIVTIPSYFAEFKKCFNELVIKNENDRVTNEDITTLNKLVIADNYDPKKEIVSVMPIGYVLDGTRCIKNPIDKSAEKLCLESIISIVPKKNIYPITEIFRALEVEILDFCFGGLSDYYEFYTKDIEGETVAVINIGKGKTEVSIINSGVMYASEVIELGGRNIDRDISYIYGISLKNSVKLKENYALASVNNASTSEMEDVLTTENEHIKINQYEVSEVVYSRVKEILDLVKSQINILTKKEINTIIITGGVSEITDFDFVYEDVFGRKNKIADIYELGVRHNKFGTCLGNIKYYVSKLNFRNDIATTFTEEEQNNMFLDNNKVNSSGLLGKVYEYFFDN